MSSIKVMFVWRTDDGWDKATPYDHAQHRLQAKTWVMFSNNTILVAAADWEHTALIGAYRRYTSRVPKQGVRQITGCDAYEIAGGESKEGVICDWRYWGVGYDLATPEDLKPVIAELLGMTY